MGCGHWGPNHIRVFNSLADSRVEAVADMDGRRLGRVRELHPGVRCERDHRRIIEDPRIDAVVIATPTSTHNDLVSEALRAGKHVLCEKPLCESSSDAAHLVERANANGRIVMVGHVFLFNPGIVKLKQLVDDGELGTLQYLSADRTNLGPIRGDVNAAYDLAAHDISIFNWLIGTEPEQVSATGASFVQPGIEDVAAISMKYPGNVLATVQTSWLNPKKVREITVVGSRQMVTWDDMQPATPIAIYDKGANTVQEPDDFGEFQRLSMWDGDIRLPKVRVDEPLRLQAEEFLQSIRTGSVVRSGAAFAGGVVNVLEAVNVSMRNGGMPISLGA